MTNIVETTPKRTQPKDIVVVAEKPEDLAVAQADLSAWAHDKVAEAIEDEIDIRESIERASAACMKITGLEKALTRARHRQTFYEKVASAIGAGYCIVPNFEVDLIAIRTDREGPEHDHRYKDSEYSRPPSLPAQQGPVLPLKEGEYVNPIPKGYRHTTTETKTLSGGKPETFERRHVTTSRWERHIVFPFAKAKPAVLSATQRAMALKVFDEIGVAPGRRARNTDPIVVGRIRMGGIKQWGVQSRGVVSFLIAWWIDTSDLRALDGRR